MGRTVPSFRMMLEGIIMELSVFRRAAPLLDPMEAVFLSILVEQQKEISSLREALSIDRTSIISDTSKEQLLERPLV